MAGPWGRLVTDPLATAPGGLRRGEYNIDRIILVGVGVGVAGALGARDDEMTVSKLLCPCKG